MFLLSFDSLEAFNELEIELWVICYSLKCDIDVLSYNLREGSGENGGRSKWSQFFGKSIDPEKSLFQCNGKKMTLLYENNVHWQLIVPDKLLCEKEAEGSGMATSSVIVDTPLSDGSGLVASGSSGSMLSPEASHSKSSVLNSVKSSRKSNLASNAKAKASKSNPEKEALKEASTIERPVGEGKIKRKSEIFNSEEEMSTKARKLTNIKSSNKVEADPFVVKEMMKDKKSKEVSVESDVYHIFRVKEPSLEDILKVPENSEEVKTASLDALDVEIRESKKKHEKEMAKVEKVIQEEKENQRNRRKRFRINALRRNKLEDELDEINLAFMFEKHRNKLEGIEKLEVSSARYEAFCKGGLKKDELKMKLFLAPFSENHIDFILNEMEASWMKTGKEQMEKNDLVWKVLLPEFLTLVIIKQTY